MRMKITYKTLFIGRLVFSFSFLLVCMFVPINGCHSSCAYYTPNQEKHANQVTYNTRIASSILDSENYHGVMLNLCPTN
jgi:hypothetical protein